MVLEMLSRTCTVCNKSTTRSDGDDDYSTIHPPSKAIFVSLRMLWRRPLQCFQLCQCSLKRDDASRSQPGHSRFPVAITGTRGRGGGGGGGGCSVGSSGGSSDSRRRLLWRVPAALLDQSAGVAEHFGKPAVLVVQPVDLRLERAERDFERAPDKAAREDVRLFVVEPAVDDALLGPTELVVCRFAKPTFYPEKPPRIESERRRSRMQGK